MRSAAPGDYDAYARLFPELGTGEPVPEREFWTREVAPTILVATLGGEVVGYAYYRILTGYGYVTNVVTAPAYRGRAIGRTLMGELARRFRAGGASRWCLNVKPDNAPAIALYRRMGMARAYESWVLFFGWELAQKLPAESGIVGRPLAPAEDSAVESTFSLLPGTLSEGRSHGGRHFLGLFEGDAPRGVAALNMNLRPNLVGSFPFRATRPSLTGNLVALMHSQAGPHKTEAQVVVENDAAIAEKLLSAGAQIRMRMEHYRGDIPQSLP